jgi:hypothetical protein
LRIGKLDDLIGSQVGELALEEFDLVNSTLRGLPRGNLRRVSIDVCDFAVLLFSIIAARANRRDLTDSMKADRPGTGRAHQKKGRTPLSALDSTATGRSRKPSSVV